MEVPLMCSGTAVLRSSVTFFPVPFICEVQSFRAPGEITVPRLYWVVIILPVFPNVALFNPYRSHCPNMYPNLGLWGFTVTALLILNMDTEGTNPGAHRDVVDVCVFFFSVVKSLFGKEKKKTQQSMAPGLHRGSGDIKGWMASKQFLSSEPSNKSSGGKEPKDESH